MKLKATTLAIALALTNQACAIVTSDEAGSHAGYGVTGHGATGSVLSSIRPRAKRAGLNVAEGISVGQPGVQHLVVDFDSGQDVHNTMFSVIGIESDLGFCLDEVLPAPGDSGGPMFIGQAIAGVHAFGRELSGADPYDSDWGELNFESRVSYFRSFLETATGGTAVFVPEPATPTIGLLTFTPLVLLYRARHPARPGGKAFGNQKTRASIRHATALLVWVERCLRSHRRKTPLHAGKLRKGEGKAVALPFVLKSQALRVCTDTLNRRALREQRLKKASILSLLSPFTSVQVLTVARGSVRFFVLFVPFVVSTFLQKRASRQTSARGPSRRRLSSLVYMEFLGPSVLSEITLPTSFDIDDWPIAAIYIDTDNIANGAVAEVHSITPITPGDFTLDGKVDSDDYGLWQSTYGPIDISEADWDRNGAVDTADYVTWRNSVSALSASASDAAVPEPASVQLAILVLLYAAQSRIIRWREPRPAQHGH